ncbi:MAG: protease [Candidatus Methanomethylicota archaeon]|uniref:Protease HtpX homolog n=1 Tax=Thermoproteota archaeon TaxID=2056631 RepID=A0A520KGU6_9CREN|nr:MAG: protease [Candidatus Verstraetearchaeota archaeon]TDA40339.1 MAG: protease [Candidatus Verstraetearchaeota archaeon]
MIRLTLMMVFLTLIFVALGYAIGLVFGAPETIALFALILAAIFNLISYFYSDKIVLLMSHAKIVSEREYPDLHNIVSKVAMMAGLPKPKVAIIDTKVPNAFATGRNPKNSVVAVTKGLLEILNESELEGVISHEIAHIKHRDILISSVVATIAGAISYLAFIGRYSIFFGDERNRNASLIAFLLSILAPFAALLIQMAISRGREYEADREGAMICKKPLSLASALEKIERYARSGIMMNINPSTSPLWIVNPFRGYTLLELFSTHPPTWKRIEKLKAMAMGIIQ